MVWDIGTMRIGLISDIHGNLEALHACLRALEGENVDEVACLGDVVGYGADPEACCDLVRKAARLCLLGNHDAGVCGRLDLSYFHDEARDAILMHRYQLSPENLAWLNALPYQATVHIAGQGGVAYCHGDPVSPQDFGYIVSASHVETSAAVCTDLQGVRAVIFGHAHLPQAFEVSSGKAKRVDRDVPIEMRRDRQYYFSVGSVGQPRDFDVRAACAVYDAGRQTFEFLRAEYDLDAAANKILAAGLPDYFALRLYRGV